MKLWMFLTPLLLTTALNVSARDLTVVGQDYEPFYYNDGTAGIAGACYEIVQKICDFEKAHCKYKFAPVPRFLEMLKDGEADIGCPLARSVPRESVFHMYTLFRGKYAFYGLPETVSKIKTYSDLKGLDVGTLAPSMTEISLIRIHAFADKSFNIDPETKFFNTLLKAQKKSNHLAYGNSDAAKRWIEKNRSPLQEIPNLGEPVAYSIAFSKKNITDSQYKKLQDHLIEMHKDGTLEKISKKYKLKASEYLFSPLLGEQQTEK